MDYADLIGTPFVYGGRSVEQGGLDCYGVVLEMSRRNGKALPERSVSEDHTLIHALMASQMNVWRKLDAPVPGCAVLIRLKKVPCHVGYLINNYEFLHAWEGSGGVVKERLTDWEKRIEGFYEYVG